MHFRITWQALKNTQCPDCFQTSSIWIWPSHQPYLMSPWWFQCAFRFEKYCLKECWSHCQHGFLFLFSFLLSSYFALIVKNLPTLQETQVRSLRSPAEGNGYSIPAFLPGEFLGQRSLAGYSPWGHKELDTTERLNFHFHRQLLQLQVCKYLKGRLYFLQVRCWEDLNYIPHRILSKWALYLYFTCSSCKKLWDGSLSLRE